MLRNKRNPIARAFPSLYLNSFLMLPALPDELWVATFAFLGVKQRLCVVDQICKRFQILLRRQDLWTLAEHTYTRDMSPREAMEMLYAVCTRRHVLNAVVARVEARNDEDRNGWPAMHGAEPLAGRSEIDNDLFMELCEVAKLGPDASVGPIASWRELAVVVELRRSTEQDRVPEDADPLPEHIDEQTRTWILPAATEGGDAYGFGHPQTTIASISVESAAEAGLLPFRRKGFVVVWAVHRPTKAVTLLHAAEPEGDAPGFLDHKQATVQVSGHAGDFMRAASNVPRRVDPLPLFKVNDFMDGVGAIPRRPHRNDAALICRVSLTPVWERDGCTGSQLLIDPRAGGLDGVDIHDSPVTADDVADAWWPCKIEVKLELDGSQHVIGQPQRQQLVRHVGESDTSFRARCFREITMQCDAIKVWARSAVLMLLSADVLWVQPRDISHVPEHDRLTSRVTHFLNSVMLREYKRAKDDDYYEGDSQGDDGDNAD